MKKSIDDKSAVKMKKGVAIFMGEIIDDIESVLQDEREQMLSHVEHNRLAKECEKLDMNAEQEMAEADIELHEMVN